MDLRSSAGAGPKPTHPREEPKGKNAKQTDPIPPPNVPSSTQGSLESTVSASDGAKGADMDMASIGLEVRTLRSLVEQLSNAMGALQGGLSTLNRTPGNPPSEPAGTLEAGAAVFDEDYSYGVSGPIPSYLLQRPAVSPAYARLPTHGAPGYILGRQNLFATKLDDVSNLYGVISHFRQFATHQRLHGDTTQAFSTTVTDRAIRELQLQEVQVALWTTSQWRNALAHNFRSLHVDLQDVIQCLRRVPLDGLSQNVRADRQFYMTNYRAIHNYLTIVEEYRAEAERLTGIPAQYAKPQDSRMRTRGAFSTVLQVVHDKLDFYLQPFTRLVNRDIDFKAATNWSHQYNQMLGNVVDATQTYLENRFLVSTFEQIERESQQKFAKSQAERAYGDAKQRIFQDGQSDGPRNRSHDQHRPSQSTDRRQLYVPPSGDKPGRQARPSGLAAIGLGNILPEERTYSRYAEEAEEEFYTPSEGESSASYQAPAHEDSEEENLDQDPSVAQDLITHLAAMPSTTNHKQQEGRPTKPPYAIERAPKDSFPGSNACWHQLIGKCSKGDACLFSHDAAEGLALLQTLEKNIKSKAVQRTTSVASLVQDEGRKATMRIRATINGKPAIVLVDPGSDSCDFISENFCMENNIPMTKADRPMKANLANTGATITSNRQAVVTLFCTSPITKTEYVKEIRAYVICMGSDDLIMGMDNICQHFVPLAIEVLLAAANANGNTKLMASYLPGMVGDVYGLAALTEEEDDPHDPPDLVPLEQWNPATKMVPRPIPGKIYPPLDPLEEAPEDAIHEDFSIFGEAEKAMMPEYASDEMYNRRLAELEEQIPLSVKPLLEQIRPQFEKMLYDKGKHVFTHRRWLGVTMEKIHIDFLPTLPESMRCRARPVPPELLPKIKIQLDKFVEQGYLKRLTTGHYGVPLVVEKKKDGELRLCGDYRPVNKYIRAIPLAMPDIHERIRALVGYSLFAELDWATAFHQLPLDEISSKRLAISTPFGLYAPAFVPEGIMVGSALLMEIVYQIFSDYDWLIAVHDNLLIGAKSPEDLMHKVELVLTRCREKNIQIKLKKSQFGVTKITFFGYVIEDGKYGIAAERIEDIQEIPFGKNLKEVQRFLGLATFVSPFVPNYADQFRHIFKMSTKDFTFVEDTWEGLDYKEEWNKAKGHLLKTCSVYFPDRTLEWVLKTDASNTGFGAALIQMMPAERLTAEERAQAYSQGLVTQDGFVPVPIALVSKAFSPQAQKWSVTEQELFAIIHALKKLENLLILKPFILETDHLNIVALADGSIALSKRCIRWRNYLSRFTYLIRHVAGIKNIVADYLSRVMEPITLNTTTLSAISSRQLQSTNRQQAPDDDIPELAPIGALRRIASAQPDYEAEEYHLELDTRQAFHTYPLEDHAIDDIQAGGTDLAIAYMQSGEPHQLLADVENLQSLQSKEDHTGLAALGDPQTAEEALTAVHKARTGHRGAVDTWIDVNRQYPNLHLPFNTVRNFVKDCPECAKIRARPEDPMTLQKSLPVYHARAITNVDLLTLEEDEDGFKYAHVFINAMTKFTVIVPVKDKLAASAALALLKYASTVGVTDTMWSDGGSEYVAEVSQEMARIVGTAWQFTLAHRPQANGTVERANQEILKAIRVLLLFPDTWRKWSSPAVISLVQMAINCRTHGSTKYTPVELTFGTAARQYYKAPEDMRRTDAEALHEFNIALADVQEAGRLNVLASQLPRLRAQPDVIVTYSPGDLVLRDPRKLTGQLPLRTHKFEPLKRGPYEVLRQERDSNTVVCCDVNDRETIHEFHHSTLTIFPGTTENAKELQKLDKFETRVIRVQSLTGNLQDRASIVVHCLFEDRTTAPLPYNVAVQMEAFHEYCAMYTIGKELSLSRAELSQYKLEQNPIGAETVSQKMRAWETAALQVADDRIITCHYWDSPTWHVRANADTMPLELRNREPLVLAKIVQISAKRVDLSIPVLAVHTPKTTKAFIITMTLADVMLYTDKGTNAKPTQLILSHELMDRCTFREEVQRAAGMIR